MAGSLESEGITVGVLMKTTIISILCSILFFTVALAFSAQYEASFTYPKLVYLYSCTLALVISWLYYRWKGDIRPIPRNVLYSALAFALWLLLSTTFAIHVPTAVFGFYGRWQGLLTHLVYIGLFLMAVSLPLNTRKVLKSFVLAMLLVAIVAITQRLNFINSPILGARSFSTIGNAIPMAACLSLAVPFCIYFTVRGKWRVLWGLVTVILLVGVVVSYSRGPELGLLAALSIVIMFTARGKAIFKFAAIAALIVLMVHFNTRNNLKHIATDSGYTDRCEYAQAALGMIRDFPVFGVGLDCYRLVYVRYQTDVSKKIEPTTKAHNGYVQYAATTGIPGLLYYLILVVCVLRSIRTDDPLLRIAFIAAIAGYLVQDFAGWEEVSLTAFFWCIIGLAIRENHSSPSS